MNIETNEIWDIFVEIYQSEASDREKYYKNLGDYVWAIASTKVELFVENALPKFGMFDAAVQREIKLSSHAAGSAGINVWVAEKIANKGQIKANKPINLQLFSFIWEKIYWGIDENSTVLEKVSNKVQKVFHLFVKSKMDYLVQCLSGQLSESILEEMYKLQYLSIYAGYSVGMVEDDAIRNAFILKDDGVFTKCDICGKVIHLLLENFKTFNTTKNRGAYIGTESGAREEGMSGYCPRCNKFFCCSHTGWTTSEEHSVHESYCEICKKAIMPINFGSAHGPS